MHLKQWQVPFPRVGFFRFNFFLEIFISNPGMVPKILLKSSSNFNFSNIRNRKM